jgi:endoglucanase
VKNNSDSIAGFAAWSAGAFDSTYELVLSPNADGSDQPLWTHASTWSFISYFSSKK